MVASHPERVHPGKMSWIFRGVVRQHLERYAYAARCVVGKRVLDVACGQGYGSNMMASRAMNVVGIDICPSAIEEARRDYPAATLKFYIGDVTRLPLDDESVDVVVSFETIEHLPIDSVVLFLREVARVLDAGGRFFVSTPERDNFSFGALPSNPHHFQEFNRDEFSELLSPYFHVDEYLGQDFTHRSCVALGRCLAKILPRGLVQKTWRGYKSLIRSKPNVEPCIHHPNAIPLFLIASATKKPIASEGK